VLATVTLAAAVEQHRATHLGNPTTRFAPPLNTPEDLRALFRNEHLRADIAEILRQWGWKGRLEDLYHAAETAEIREVRIAVGAVMPFMSSRENGKPVCLRNVTWAGQEPAPAYLFDFISNRERYRCVTPKACSNFYLEDLGPAPIPGLALQCDARAEAFLGRPFEVCFTVRNPGTGPVPAGRVHFAVPGNATVTGVGEGGVVNGGEVGWDFANLAPKAERKFCAHVEVPTAQTLTLRAVASGSGVAPTEASCATRVMGIAAILIDAVDLEDPVPVGGQVIYEVKVTNQGSVEATNIRLAFVLPSNEEFVSGGGASSVRRDGAAVETEPLASLAPKDAAVWRVVVNAKAPGDVRFKIALTSDQFAKPINEEESTAIY